MMGSRWLCQLKSRESDPARLRAAMVARLRVKVRALSPDAAHTLLESFGGPSGQGSTPTQVRWIGCWSQSLDQDLRRLLGRRASESAR